jgi:uncharacterized membrane protein YqjE
LSPVTDPGDGRRSEGPVGRLLASTGGLLASLVDIGRTRVELLAVEVQEEIRRTAGLLALGFAALFAAGVGCLLAGLTLIFAYWDTHRVLVASLVTLAFFLAAAAAALALSARLKARPRLLADTLAELERDRDTLRGRS